MSEATLPLSRLADGDFFRLELVDFDRPGSTKLVHTGWTYGQRLYGNDSRIRVRLAGGQRQVTFDASNGKTREFESNGISEMNYPTGLEVVRVDPNASEQSAPPTEREWSMAEAQEKAIRARWNVASKALVTAKASGDEGKIEVAQKRVDGLIVEAEQKGINLEAREAGTQPDGAASTKAPTSQKTADKAGVAKLVAAKAKADPKAAKTPKEKKLPSTSNCLCGCGLETGGRFRPGHDARVKGWLHEVERGTKNFDELPEALRATVKMAGKKASAGKDNSDYRVVQSPVKFPGRPEIAVV